MNINAEYERWLENVDDEVLEDDLKCISGNDEEIRDRFSDFLDFGTGGLRGILGAGTNRMNIYTVRHATQGLAAYLCKNYENPSVAIAYDSRINSELFAQEAAGVLAANGVHVYLFPELTPTPILSFAVRELKTSAGIVITASHNPSVYNGYKAYNNEGCQLTGEAADSVKAEIRGADIFSGVKYIPLDEGKALNLIEYIGGELLNKYTCAIKKCSINPDVLKNSDLKVIYTPLHGTGNIPVRRILKETGIKELTVVEEQRLPDGNFPTASYPNPEDEKTFKLALELAKTKHPDLIIATDPDADRVGIAVRDENGDYPLLTGNDVGCLLMDYILKCRKENGTLPQNPVAVTTIVSTPLAAKIGESYGATVFEVLTGFKYIGEKIDIYGDAFVLGFEESYGYLVGDYARDKDAVVASMLICEMAAYYKNQGKTIHDALNEIYEKFGVCLNLVKSPKLDVGMAQMKEIIKKLRQSRPDEICGRAVTEVSDYENSLRTVLSTGETSEIDLPKSDVLSYTLEDGCRVIVRPSGTEPKIKIYITSFGQDKEKTKAELEKLFEATENILISLK